MTPYSLEDGGNLPSMISRLAGATIRALALVGTVGAGSYASVIAFITPDCTENGHPPRNADDHATDDTRKKREQTFARRKPLLAQNLPAEVNTPQKAERKQQLFG